MPALIGAVLAIAAPILSTTVLGVSLGTLLGSAVLIGASVGLRAVLKPGRQQQAQSSYRAPPGPVTAEPESVPIGPLFWSYGRVRVGPRQFFREAQAGVLGYGGVVNCRPVTGVVGTFIDDELPTYSTGPALHGSGGQVWGQGYSTFDEGPTVFWPATGKKWVSFATYVWIPNYGAVPSPVGSGPTGYLEFYNASPAGTVSVLLKRYFPTYWNDAHLAQDLTVSYSVWRTANIQDRTAVYPNLFPKVSLALDGARIFDPRNATQSLLHAGVWDVYNPTWAFSANPALILLDYLMHPRGCGLAPQWINFDSFKQAASDCDRLAPKFGGGFEPFATAHLTVATDQDRRDNIARLTAACDGSLFEDPLGRVSLWIRQWVEPTIVLTAADISELEIAEASGVYAEHNIVNYTYVEPRNNFAKINGPSARDDDAIERVGERASQIDFEAVHSFSQAYRLATRALRMEAVRLKITIRGGPRLLLADGEFAVRVACPEYGVDGVFAPHALAAEDLAHVTGVFYELTPAMFEDVLPDMDPVNGSLPGVTVPPTNAPVQPPVATTSIAIAYSGAAPLITGSAIVTASIPAPHDMVHAPGVDPARYEDNVSVARFRWREVDSAHAPLGDWAIWSDIIGQYAARSPAVTGAAGAPPRIFEIQSWLTAPLGTVGDISPSAFVEITL